MTRQARKPRFAKPSSCSPNSKWRTADWAWRLRARGQDEAAVRELEVATRLDPSDADAHYELADTAWALSRAVFGIAARPGNRRPGLSRFGRRRV